MLQIKVSKTEFDKINTLLPELCPNVSFTLISQDDVLVSLGFCDSAPCVVEFDLSVEEYNKILDMLDDIEFTAFNIFDNCSRIHRNAAYRKYLKYGCLYPILHNAEKIVIGKVKYVGKSFGVESLTDGKVYDCVGVESPFIRVIDDSDEDYLYSITKPSSMEDPTLCGNWVIVEDPNGILKEYIKEKCMLRVQLKIHK